MKKRNVIIALLCAATMAFSACGTAASSSTAASSTATAPSTAESQSMTGTLTVYCPQADADRGAWLKEKAETALGFTVDLLGGTGGDLAERLRAEKSNPQADVIMGLVQTAMYQLKDEGLLAQYTPSWADGLPDVYKDKDGYFYSFWQTPIILGYNPEFVKNAPTSWQDLAKDEYKGLYAIGKTSSQTVRTYIIGLLWPYYDEAAGDFSQEGWDLLRKLYENAYSLPTDADSWKLFKEGTLPITLNWFGGAKSKAASYEAPIEYVKPADGTPVVAEGIAIVNGTSHEAMAQAFMEWWGDPATMAEYANKFGQAPAHPDAIALCNDEVKADAEMFTAQAIDWEVCSQKIDEWFEKVLRAWRRKAA